MPPNPSSSSSTLQTSKRKPSLLAADQIYSPPLPTSPCEPDAPPFTRSNPHTRLLLFDLLCSYIPCSRTSPPLPTYLFTSPIPGRSTPSLTSSPSFCTPRPPPYRICSSFNNSYVLSLTRGFIRGTWPKTVSLHMRGDVASHGSCSFGVDIDLKLHFSYASKTKKAVY